MFSKILLVTALFFSSNAFACKLSALGASLSVNKAMYYQLIKDLPKTAWVRAVVVDPNSAWAEVIDAGKCEVLMYSFNIHSDCKVTLKSEITARGCYND